MDGANISVPNGYLTECYDELGTQYKVPIYCLSYPINIVKEDNGRDSPAEYSEPVDGGTEVVLKLRLSSTCQDVKLSVYSRDTIGQSKKKLQVRFNYHLYICKIVNHFSIKNRLRKVLMHVASDGFMVANFLEIKFMLKRHIYNQVM